MSPKLSSGTSGRISSRIAARALPGAIPAPSSSIPFGRPFLRTLVRRLGHHDVRRLVREPVHEPPVEARDLLVPVRLDAGARRARVAAGERVGEEVAGEAVGGERVAEPALVGDVGRGDRQLDRLQVVVVVLGEPAERLAAARARGLLRQAQLEIADERVGEVLDVAGLEPLVAGVDRLGVGLRPEPVLLAPELLGGLRLGVGLRADPGEQRVVELADPVLAPGAGAQHRSDLVDVLEPVAERDPVAERELEVE